MAYKILHFIIGTNCGSKNYILILIKHSVTIKFIRINRSNSSKFPKLIDVKTEQANEL